MTAVSIHPAGGANNTLVVDAQIPAYGVDHKDESKTRKTKNQREEDCVHQEAHVCSGRATAWW